MFESRRQRLASGTTSRRTQRTRRKFTVEALEERVVLSPTIFTVNTNVDGTESGTLRWAITQANNNSTTAGSVITFAAGVGGETINLSSTLGTLDLTETAGPEQIEGPSGVVTVSGDLAFGVFDVASGVKATIQGLNITGGNASNSGGGIDNNGTLTINDCSVTDNSALIGGGIFTAGALTLTNSTVSGNSARATDGGIFSEGDALTLTNSTVSGNSARTNAGIANEEGALTLTNCTVSANSANYSGGGLYSAGDTATLTDTIVAGNNAGSVASDISLGSASSVTGSYNLIGTGGSGGIANGVHGNIVLTGSETAGLAPLGNYAGPTYTMALMPGSPAIGTGSIVSGITTDQRGEIRGSVVDIGAVQVSLVVESTAGTVSEVPSSLTLPGAVSLADTYSDSEITFGPNVFGTPQTITLASGTLDLTNTVGTTTITGPTAGVTISGGNAVQVFDVASQVNATISGLTITEGNADEGGGLYNSGTVTLNDCTISGNSAGGNGGGVYNYGNRSTHYGATLTLNGCTISGNSAGAPAGGCATTARRRSTTAPSPEISAIKSAAAG